MFKLLIFMLFTAVESESPSITTLIQMGEFGEAEVLIQKRFENQIPDHERMDLLTLYGDIWFYRNKFDAALEQYYQALDLAKVMDDNFLQAAQMKNIAIAYSELKHYGESLNWHQQAKNAMKHELNNNTGMSILLSEAMIFNQVGAPELAMETLVQAQNIAFHISNEAGLNNSYLRLASFYLKSNAYPEARSKLMKVDLNSFGDMNDLLWYYQLRLTVELGLNQFFEAEKRLNQFNAIAANSSYQDDAYIKQLSVYLNTAQGDFEASHELIIELEQSQKLEAWQVSYLWAHWFNAQNKHLKAFEYYQQANTRFVEEKINQADVGQFIQPPASLLQETIVNAHDIGFGDMSKLFQWMNGLYLAKHPHFSKDAKLPIGQSSLGFHGQTDQGYAEVFTDVRKSQFSQLLYDKIKLESLQDSLKQEEGFLFYLSIKNQLFAFLVDSKSANLLEINQDFQVLNDEISQFINTLSQSDDWMSLSQRIEKKLIHPLRTYGLDKYKNLYIVPDDNIRFLPFDLLLDEQGELMLNKHRISFHTIHSLQQFIAARGSVDQTSEPANNRMSFVGTVTAMESIPGYWRTAYRNLDFENQGFEGVKKEHDLIKSMGLPGKILLNNLATETSAADIIENETGILHVASHGFDNPVAPAFSSLVLTENETDDGLLQAREVAMLKSKLSLVVLASCSSAKGGLQGRYGFQLGLAEAFLQAGANSVIGTLWDVKDQRTYQFMQWFYQIMERVDQPLLALNLTKKKAIDARWQVKDWSAFVLLGDGTDLIVLNIDSTSNHVMKYFWSYLFSLLVLLLMLFIVLKKLKKEKNF